MIFRLKNNIYQNISDILNDFKLLTENAVRFFGSDHYLTKCANFLLDRFIRKTNKYAPVQFEDWHNDYAKLSQKMNEMINNIARKNGYNEISFSISTIPSATKNNNILPERSSPVSPPNNNNKQSNQVSNSSSNDSIQQTHLQNNQQNKPLNNQQEQADSHHSKHKTVSDAEINWFLSSLGNLHSTNDSRALVKIILTCQPELDVPFPDAKINIDDLNDDTIKKCIEFAKQRHVELNKLYPSAF